MQTGPQGDGGVWARQWLRLSWDEVHELVLRRCRFYLRGTRSVDPEDVAQDVLVTLLRRDFGKGYDPRLGKPESYLGCIIRRKCVDAIRRARRRGCDVTGIDLPASAPGPVASAQAAELADAIDNVLSALTPGELSALPRVVGAGGSRTREGTTDRRRHVRATRCRSRLRQLLDSHRPEQGGDACRRRQGPKLS